MALSECNTIINANRREINLHGTSGFPVACYQDNLTNEDVPWHWHDELEALIIVKGEALITAGTEKYTIKQGDGLFINAGILHAGWNADINECILHSVVFHPRLVGGSIDSIFWQSYLQPLLKCHSLTGIFLDHNISWHKEALDSIENTYQACVQEPFGYEFSAREQLSKLILLLLGHQSFTEQKPSEKAIRNSARLKTMLQFIQDSFAENITVEQIAHSAMISDSECLRCFRSTIGITPMQYVKQFRIQKATELLSSTSLKVIDIGMQCGFLEMSYFSKTFKGFHGCTPSEYRKHF